MKQLNSFLPVFLLSLLLPALLRAQGLIIPPGGHVTVNAGNLVMRQNWTNNGSFAHKGGTVVFAGTAQSISGATATTFRDLLVASGSSTTINAAGQSVARTLKSNGVLNAGGYLTLLSTDSQTALIDGSGSGEVLGTVTMQRYLPSAFGYKYFSAPFQDATVGGFANELDLLAAFPVLYRFDEDRTDDGWVSYTTASAPLTPMQGYAANFGASPLPRTANLSGVVNNGTVSLGNLFNHNKAFTKGFQLVGNPYPSPIDWNAASGWTRTNIDNAIYYFDAGNTDQYLGTYSSYINGISSNGIAGNIIPAMQGFFVHVSDGVYPTTGSLSVNNNARINNLNPVFHRTSGEDHPLLRLRAGLEGQASADPLVVYLEDQASAGFDRAFDALKLMNTDGQVPSLYALSADANRLSIDAVPYQADSLQIIPLGVSIGQSGWIHFTATEIERMPAGIQLYLYDAQTGSSQELQANPMYRAHVEKGKQENRFYLALGRAGQDPALLKGNSFSAFGARGKLFVDLNAVSGGHGELQVTNALGQVVLRRPLDGYGRHELDAGWSSGVYIVSLQSAQGIHSQKIFINHP